MSGLITSILGAAILSIGLWTVTTVLVRPLIRRDAFLHLTTVHLSVIAFVLLNVWTILGIARWLQGETLAIGFGFVMGVQLIASLSALLFVRDTARRRRERRDGP